MRRDARDGVLRAPALALTGAVVFAIGGAFLNGFSRSEDFGGDDSSALIALPIVGGLGALGSLIWLVGRAERREEARRLLPDLEENREALQDCLRQLSRSGGARVTVRIAPVLTRAVHGVSLALGF